MGAQVLKSVTTSIPALQALQNIIAVCYYLGLFAENTETMINQIWHLILFPSNLVENFPFNFNTAESKYFSSMQYWWLIYTINIFCVDLTKNVQGT